MTHHEKLLRHAVALAEAESSTPDETTLRLSASTAYYALFHFLISRTTNMLFHGEQLPVFRNLASRAFHHSEMRDASRAFLRPKLPDRILDNTGEINVSLPVQRLAQIFVDVQDARHVADYNLATTFSRAMVSQTVFNVRQAFTIVTDTFHQIDTKLYLFSLLSYRDFRE